MADWIEVSFPRDLWAFGSTPFDDTALLCPWIRIQNLFLLGGFEKAANSTNGKIPSPEAIGNRNSQAGANF